MMRWSHDNLPTAAAVRPPRGTDEANLRGGLRHRIPSTVLPDDLAQATLFQWQSPHGYAA
ncbi:hypothetical protein [Methylacidiphilum caldifontis]|uniref:hypothetical protein n=1 Tax=Methylacidiphilum caldifontis TaxID=2795386 RepID=UPI001F5D325E|nr:hypothetical protein [Methylacidiphilum caldifontis]